MNEKELIAKQGEFGEVLESLLTLDPEDLNLEMADRVADITHTPEVRGMCVDMLKSWLACEDPLAMLEAVHVWFVQGLLTSDDKALVTEAITSMAVLISREKVCMNEDPSKSWLI